MTPAILFLIAATLLCAMVYEGPQTGDPIRVIFVLWVLVPFAVFIFTQVEILNSMLRGIHFRLVPESKD